MTPIFVRRSLSHWQEARIRPNTVPARPCVNRAHLRHHERVRCVSRRRERDTQYTVVRQPVESCCNLSHAAPATWRWAVGLRECRQGRSKACADQNTSNGIPGPRRLHATRGRHPRDTRRPSSDSPARIAGNGPQPLFRYHSRLVSLHSCRRAVNIPAPWKQHLILRTWYPMSCSTLSRMRSPAA